MLLSKKWLQDFVEIPKDLSDQDLAERISACTVEVEGIETQGENLDGVVVGELLEIKKHPNADKLSIAQVDVGEEKPRQIVFGQMVPMQVGYKIPVALAPTILPGNKIIKKAVMRGETSEGMLCLDQELGFLKEGVSIKFFEKQVKNGTSIKEAMGLDDVIFDVDNKSLTNRPDLFGHYGMAREIAALLNTKFTELVPKKNIEGKGYELSVSVVEPELCPRYMGIVIDGIKIAPSPEWIQKRLLAVGMRPINNVVDITNYVMLKVGQSLHAFDAKKLENAEGKEKKVEIVIRRANDKEKFSTLDGKEYELDSSTLMICDGKKSVTMAGIMGGQNSEIDENTTTVFLESASFNSSCIRKTSQKLGLRTEASLRYEKSLDPNLSELALYRAVELIFELIPGTRAVSKVVDVSNFQLNQGPIVLPIRKINSKLGLEMKTEEAVDILERLGFEVREKDENLMVKIPSWRATKDISIAEDLIEEIVRVYGYDKVEASLPFSSVTPPIKDPVRELERKIRRILSGRFLATETYNYSFVSPAILEKLGEKTEDYIELANPLSKERPYLRRHLAANLLENIEKNQKFVDTVRLFEIGCRYIAELSGDDSGEGKVLPRQDHWVGVAFSAKGDEKPFREVKKIMSGLLKDLGFDFEVVTAKEKAPWFHPSRSAEILVAGQTAGYISEVEPGVAQSLGLDSRTAVGELNLSQLAVAKNQPKIYEKIPEFPDAKRDLAFTVAQTTEYASLQKSIYQLSSLLHAVELFDVYQGKGIDPDKKSLAVHLTFRSVDRTLSSEEVDGETQKIRDLLINSFGAIIR